MFDKSDPYAEVRWNGELIGRSRVMEDATSPEWNESFVIRVAPTQQNVLSIELFDFDGDLFELKNNLITSPKPAADGEKRRSEEEVEEVLGDEMAERLGVVRKAADKTKDVTLDSEPDFLGEVVLSGVGARMLPNERTEFTLQRKPNRDRVIATRFHNHMDGYNAAVGGYLTFWFTGAPEDEGTDLHSPGRETVESNFKQKTKEKRETANLRNAGAKRRERGSRAALDAAKRPFAFRTDPVDLSFAEVRSWDAIAAVATERGYHAWEQAETKPKLHHAAPDAGKREEPEEEGEKKEEDRDDPLAAAFAKDTYRAPSDELCTQCKLVAPTPPTENIMGKIVFDGLCDHCGGRVLPPKRRTSRMAALPGGGKRPSSSESAASKKSRSIVRHGRRSGSVSPTRAANFDPPKAQKVRPRMGRRHNPERPPALADDKLTRTMADWGVGGAAVGVERGYPVNWPSAYPDVGLPFTSGGHVTKSEVVTKLTNSALYTGTHRHRFDRDGKGRGLAGRESVPKGDGTVSGKFAAHKGLCARQDEQVGVPDWGATGHLNQVFDAYRDGLFFRDGFDPVPKGSKIQPKGLLVDDAVCLANNQLRDWNGFAAALSPLLCMASTTSLHRLDLSHNLLTGITEEAVAACPNLLVLNLHANRIRELEAVKALKNLQRLEQLTLYGNPVEADITPPVKAGVAFDASAEGRGRYRSGEQAAPCVALNPQGCL